MATATTPGTASSSHQTVDPHWGQKWKARLFPLSPVRRKIDDEPETVTAARGKRALALNTLPVRFWHARQWQIETRTGSPSHATESWRQAQVAVLIMTGSLCNSCPDAASPALFIH